MMRNIDPSETLQALQSVLLFHIVGGLDLDSCMLAVRVTSVVELDDMRGICDCRSGRSFGRRTREMSVRQSINRACLWRCFQTVIVL